MKRNADNVIVPDVEGRMENAELGRYREILERMLDSIERTLRKRDEIAVENVPDALDGVQQAADRELAISQIEATSSRMHSIELALERIDDGSYGTCLRCDEEISPKRLLAVPWAENCVHCQEMADHDRLRPQREAPVTTFRLREIA